MAKLKKTSALASIAAQFKDAAALVDEARAIDDPDPNFPRDGIRAGQWAGAPHNAMPPGCPVRVLGKKGGVTYVISAHGELHAVERWDLNTLANLFTPYINYLHWAWPAFGKAEGEGPDGEPLPPKVKRVERDKAALCLQAEAGRRGLFDPEENERGRGGWRAQDRMIWHSGKYLWSVDVKTDKDNRATGWELKASQTGEHDGYFYSQKPRIMEPWKAHIDTSNTPAHEIADALKSWQWERPKLDPIFTLGWIASGYLSGALSQRPILFTMGGAGTGKSTLHALIQSLYGSALYSTANTTAAGIYQNIGKDSRPIAVDEFERKANSFKEQAIIELARQSYSGAKGYRGGANGEGTEFQLRSPFMFSAILPPAMGVQDRTRMIILNLNPLDKRKACRQPVIHEEWGRMLLRQVMDGFHDLHYHIMPKWRAILSDSKLNWDQRAIDTYGTVLACAELLIGEEGMIKAGMPGNVPFDPDEAPTIDLVALVDMLYEATAAEREAQLPKWQEVIEKIMEAKIEGYRGGERQTVGAVIGELEQGEAIMSLDQARRQLALLGLGLRERKSPFEGYALAIPHSSDNLNRIFETSEFNHGGWVHALRQAPGDIVPRGLDKKLSTVKINHVAKAVLLVDLKAYDAWTGGE